MVLFTGVSVSSAATATVRAARWSAALSAGGIGSDEAEAENGLDPPTRSDRAVPVDEPVEDKPVDEPIKAAEEDEVFADPVVADPEPVLLRLPPPARARDRSSR